MDKELELLHLKHENLHLAFDSLFVNMGERMSQFHKNKYTLGKRNASRDNKEALHSWIESTLENFGQASSKLVLDLYGAKEALDLYWKNQ